VIGPILALGALSAKAVYDLAQTQDPMEQMRYMAGPRALNRKLTPRDLNMEDVNSTYDHVQLGKLVEEGVIDQSVLDAYKAPGVERIPDYVPPGESAKPAKASGGAAASKAPAAAARPARGSTGNLMMGARGEGVAEVQKKLSALSTMTPGVSFDLGSTGADSIFGEKTKAAVEDFQRMSGIQVDGIVGPETQAALDKAMGAAIGAKEAEMAAKANVDAPKAATPQFGAGLKRVDEGAFDDAAKEFDNMAVVKPGGSDRDAPTQNTQAYLDLGLDEEVRASAFPMFRRRRNRK
jgi:hypothetical protein